MPERVSPRCLLIGIIRIQFGTYKFLIQFNQIPNYEQIRHLITDTF
jgi:hypothetical protein